MEKLTSREMRLKLKRRVSPKHKTLLIKEVPLGLHHELKRFCSRNNRFMNETILQAIEYYIKQGKQ